MPGWTRRRLFLSPPFFLPEGIRAQEEIEGSRYWRLLPFCICLLLAFVLAAGARLLEIPFWDTPAYKLGTEYLLATHDAYHWIAGAEGFEFGTGHPMSELARILGEWLGTAPALVGFWLPSVMSGLLAVAIFLWGWGLGSPFAGLCAGVLASLSPAFYARTLLGFYDSDLVVLLFAVLLGLVPALWLSPWLTSLPEALLAPFFSRRGKVWPEPPDVGVPVVLRSAPFVPLFFGKAAQRPGLLCFTQAELEKSILSWRWLVLLALAGLLGNMTQDWHSFFPYLVRYCALISPLVILLLGPQGGRNALCSGALCHALPLLLGWPGLVLACIYACALIATRSPEKAGTKQNQNDACRRADDNEAEIPLSLTWRLYPPSFAFQRGLVRGTFSLFLLWGGILFLTLDASVFAAMERSFFAYVNRAGDIAAVPTVADPIIFPSVAQSIIEVQTVSLHELFVYIYPVEGITLICLFLAVCRLLVTPALIWFVPLLALSLLSVRMGARMTMFGPPILMLALCMEGGLLFEMIFQAVRRKFFAGRGSLAQQDARILTLCKSVRNGCAATLSFSLRLAVCLACTFFLAWPLIMRLPEYTQGPSISREQAMGLSYLKEYSPRNSRIWNWWDWGYATQHFARRYTIADGARHGGPSLFLPAAVYTTADPRFARQVIKYTASKDNQPGEVFAGLSATQAQQLMRDLANKDTPLISAPGKQYLVVSFELLRLGLWVTRYGSWNFESKESSGSLINNLSAGLTFNMDNGIILRNDGQPVYAASISLIAAHALERKVYNRYGAYHFIFNTQYLEADERPSRLKRVLRDFWREIRPDYSFPSVISDKLAMDEVFYNTMMVQLLLCPKDDPAISPYFKLVFDNYYTRIYEVR